MQRIQILRSLSSAFNSPRSSGSIKASPKSHSPKLSALLSSSNSQRRGKAESIILSKGAMFNQDEDSDDDDDNSVLL